MKLYDDNAGETPFCRELCITLSKKLPQNPAAPNVAAAEPNIKPGPPPILTRRGADVLLRVERMMDDAASKAAPARSTTDAAPPVLPQRQGALAVPETLAANAKR